MISAETARWHPGIGDPTLIGWVTVVAYAIACVLCYLCMKHSKGDYYSKREARIWLMLTLILGFLCINKQLDLQSLLTQIGRDMASSEGWYENRGFVQLGFIIALGTCALLTQIWLYLALRDLCKEIRWATVGLVFLFAFVVIRAASFHHMDIWIHSEILGMRMNWLMELGGIAFIGVSAYLRLKRDE